MFHVCVCVCFFLGSSGRTSGTFSLLVWGKGMFWSQTKRPLGEGFRGRRRRVPLTTERAPRLLPMARAAETRKLARPAIAPLPVCAAQVCRTARAVHCDLLAFHPYCILGACCFTAIGAAQTPGTHMRTCTRRASVVSICCGAQPPSPISTKNCSSHRTMWPSVRTSLSNTRKLASR